MKTRIVLGLVLFFFFSACLKKNDNTYHTIIKGKVIDYGSKQPMDSVLVWLQDGVEAGGWLDLGRTSSNKNSSTYTDKNGCFEIELRGEHMAGLFLSKKNYSFNQDEIKFFSDGIYQNEVFEMSNFVSFKPILKSKELSLDTDSLLIQYFYKHEEGRLQLFRGKGPFDGYDSGIGNTYKSFRISLWRNGVKSIKLDSVYLKASQTYNDTICY